MYRKRNQFGTYSSLTVLSIVVLFPILWMISISLRDNKDVFTIPPKWIPTNPSFQAFIDVFNNPDLMIMYFNSYFISILVTLICVLFAALAGYGFSRFRFAGKKAVLLYILLTQMFPMILLSVPYFLIITKVGLYDSYIALVIAYTSFALPLSILMMRDFINSIPRELDESATLDGCNSLQTFFYIILPPSLPGIIATGVYTFILAWNEFLFAIVLTQSVKARPLTIGIGMLIGEFTTEWNQLAALSLMSSIPLIIVFIFIQKYLLQGLTAGSIK